MILLWNKIYEYPIANRKQAENYLKRHTMQEFIATRAFNEFLIGRQYGRMVVQWFVVYMLLNLWLYKAGGDGALYTDAQLNAAIYRILTTLYIPAHLAAGTSATSSRSSSTSTSSSLPSKTNTPFGFTASSNCAGISTSKSFCANCSCWQSRSWSYWSSMSSPP